MKRRAAILSHLAALLGGLGLAICLAVMVPVKRDSQSEPASPPERREGGDASMADTGKQGRAEPKAGRRAADFRAAWRLLALRTDPIATRLENQRKLLTEWAQVDLAGAMDAAMAEAWDDDVNGREEHPLVGALQKGFRADPLGAWKLIQSGRYGAGAMLLRKEWINSVAYSDPVLVVSMLNEMSVGLRREAISSAMIGAKGDRDKMSEMIAKLATFPPGAETEELIRFASVSIPDGGDPALLLGKWSGLAAGPQRTAALLAWGASLRNADRETLDAQWQGISEAERGDAARALIAQLRPDSPALLPVLDTAMAAGEWDSISRLGPGLLLRYKGEPRELAEWTMQLPERDEVMLLFKQATSQYLTHDFAGAKNWVEAMEQGGRRDQALFQYVKAALEQQRSPAESEWATGQITDPDMKASAEKWQVMWEEHMRKRQGE